MGKLNSAEQTRQSILDAFCELVCEKENFGGIGVKEIIDRAGISRSTFYSHFNNINDLVEEICRAYADGFCDAMSCYGRGSDIRNGYQDLYFHILQYVSDNQPIATTMLLNFSNSEITEANSYPVREKMYQMLRVTHMDMEESTLRYAATFWGHGIYGFLKEWLKNDCRPGAAEMSKIMVAAIGTSTDFLLGANLEGR